MKSNLKLCFLFLAFAACKSRSDSDTKDLTIRHADGRVEDTNKGLMTVEIFTGDENKSEKKIYFQGLLNQPGQFLFSDNNGKAKNILKPTVLYNHKPYNDNLLYWLQPITGDNNLPSDTNFNLMGLAPRALASNLAEPTHHLRGLNFMAGGNKTGVFKVGFKDDTFDLFIDLQKSPPEFILDFKTYAYPENIMDLGMGIKFDCNYSAQTTGPGIFTTQVDKFTLESVSSKMLPVSAAISKVNGKDFSCKTFENNLAKLALALDEELGAQNLEFEVQTAKSGKAAYSAYAYQNAAEKNALETKTVKIR